MKNNLLDLWDDALDVMGVIGEIVLALLLLALLSAVLVGTAIVVAKALL